MSENSAMQNMTTNAIIPALLTALKRLHYPLKVMLVCVRWYAAYLFCISKTI
jgi:transposase-like protein